MSHNTIEQSTLDAWRIWGCTAVLLLCCSTLAIAFASEDQQKLKRCLRARGASPELCLLTVYGR